MCAIAMEEQELTSEEVAKRLRVHQRTVLRLIQEGEIPARKQGKRYRVLESDLQAYRERTKYEPQKEGI